MGGFFSSLWSKLFYQRDFGRAVMIGLDGAGKTTILYKLKDQDAPARPTVPTIGFNVEDIESKTGSKLTVWDVGGQDKVRQLWRHYYAGAQSLIFVIDSADTERLGEYKYKDVPADTTKSLSACQELWKAMEEEDLKNATLLIFANKQDNPKALNVQQICDRLNLNALGKNRKWHIQGTNALKGVGLIEGFEWLTQTNAAADGAKK